MQRKTKLNPPGRAGRRCAAGLIGALAALIVLASVTQVGTETQGGAKVAPATLCLASVAPMREIRQTLT